MSNEAAKKMMDHNVRRSYTKAPDKAEQIEFLLKVLRKELEREGSYYEFGQSVPWNLDDRRSMAVKVSRLFIYNERPVEELPIRLEENEDDQR